MSWVGATGFVRRPLVIVEDHLHHVTELLDALKESDPGMLAQVTVACLDRPGPDTARLVSHWLAAHPALQVAAASGPVPSLDPAVFESSSRLAKALAAMLRPGGLLLQDIQLSTLGFIPPDRWWESIYIANTVRGMFPENPPTCRFLSNKRGYEATFGRDLLDAGFDPRDVLDTRELRGMVVPVVRSTLERAFPLVLRMVRGSEVFSETVVGRTEGDRREVECELDLVLWQGSSGDQTVEIGGRLLPEGDRRPACFKPCTQEAVTWIELVEDRLRGG
ncbi:MAG TPA: hypothetical protein VE685_14330, partial [Thermoanaerobaculia bacterium]|nr:hypothetical protein [Thermoanaerobaculia bacterium]